MQFPKDHQSSAHLRRGLSHKCALVFAVFASAASVVCPVFAKQHHHPSPSSSQSASRSPEARCSRVVQTARSLRGSRYAMGGTSRSGFDCSGFVRYILSTGGGVDMPRTASEQYYHGRSVERSHMQPGDLVFFKNTYRHGISHVGVFIGNGNFIHAANSHEGVREDSLSSGYYSKHFAGVRRVLPTLLKRG